MLAQYRYHAGQRDSQQARIARDWACSANDLLASGVLDKSLSRYARMGIHLANYRYAAKSDWKYRTLELYAAVLANPKAVMDPKFPRRELMPARDPIWAMLSRIKRKLGFKPRSA